MTKFPIAVVLFTGRREFRLRFLPIGPRFDTRKVFGQPGLFGLVVGRDSDL